MKNLMPSISIPKLPASKVGGAIGALIAGQWVLNDLVHVPSGGLAVLAAGAGVWFLSKPSAGTFNLNCSFHGIPCIGYSNVNTQKILHPSTTVEVGDIVGAKELARKLKDDKFYDKCMKETQRIYKNYYSEDKFRKRTLKIIESL